MLHAVRTNKLTYRIHNSTKTIDPRQWDVLELKLILLVFYSVRIRDIDLVTVTACRIHNLVLTLSHSLNKTHTSIGLPA